MAELCVILPEQMIEGDVTMRVTRQSTDEQAPIVRSPLEEGQCGVMIPTDAWVSIPLTGRRACIVETRSPYLPFVAIQGQSGDHPVVTAIEHFALEATPAGPFAMQQPVDECVVGDISVVHVTELPRRVS